MPYEIQGFEDGMVLEAEHLRNIEQGIKELEDAVDDKANSSELKKEIWTLTMADGSTVEKVVWTA